MKTHILIFEHDLIKYPPILSLINFLFKKGEKIVFIGDCHDASFIDEFRKKGGEFYKVIHNQTNDSIINKTANYFRFKKRAYSIVKNFEGKDTKLWLLGEKSTWLMHDLTFRFSTNIYLFEIPSFKVSRRYLLLSPSLNYGATLRRASKVICCEYNRAHITRSYFHLRVLPTIIPNKPNMEAQDMELDEGMSDALQKMETKKIILYQGIFNFPERRLDEFCEAVLELSDEFVLCLMGSDNEYKKKLETRYKSEKIVFLPYVPAPYHLNITNKAHIGVLVYNSEGGNIENTLNTLYCAPNKIFEYSKFEIPMISNDVPALDLVFKEYKAGLVTLYNKKHIKEQILKIDADYSAFSEGARRFHNSINLEELYQSVL